MKTTLRHTKEDTATQAHQSFQSELNLAKGLIARITRHLDNYMGYSAQTVGVCEIVDVGKSVLLLKELAEFFHAGISTKTEIKVRVRNYLEGYEFQVKTAKTMLRRILRHLATNAPEHLAAQQARLFVKVLNHEAERLID